MIALSISAIFLTVLLMFSKSIWNRLLSLSSLSVKISIMILVVAFAKRSEYIADVGVLYLVVSGAGMMVIISFLIRGEME